VIVRRFIVPVIVRRILTVALRIPILPVVLTTLLAAVGIFLVGVRALSGAFLAML
jgi:hypothetical protein